MKFSGKYFIHVNFIFMPFYLFCPFSSYSMALALLLPDLLRWFFLSLCPSSTPTFFLHLFFLWLACMERNKRKRGRTRIVVTEFKKPIFSPQPNSHKCAFFNIRTLILQSDPSSVKLNKLKDLDFGTLSLYMYMHISVVCTRICSIHLVVFLFMAFLGFMFSGFVFDCCGFWVCDVKLHGNIVFLFVGIAEVNLDGPEAKNTIGMVMLSRLQNSFEAVYSDFSVNVTVICGSVRRVFLWC